MTKKKGALLKVCTCHFVLNKRGKLKHTKKSEAFTVFQAHFPKYQRQHQEQTAVKETAFLDK